MVDIEATFDLTEYSVRDYKKARPIRWEFGIIAIALGATLVAIFAYQLETGGLENSLRTTYGTGYVLPAVGIAVCAWAYRMLAPGATRLVIDDDGIRFGFLGGQDYSMSWSDRGFRLKLVDYRRNPVALKYGVECYVKFRTRPTSLLSERAFAEIITRARQHQLDVHERTIGGGWRGSPRDQILIRSSASQGRPFS